MSSTIAVVVTYGDRRYLLEQTLGGLYEQGIEKIVIVDNGATWDILSLLNKTKYKHLIEIKKTGKNKGSAAGFSIGISHAMRLGGEMIWMLDDDLVPTPGCLSVLQGAYGYLLTDTSRDLLIVQGTRPSYIKIITAEKHRMHLRTRMSSFLEFNILDIPKKLRRRLWNPTRPTDNTLLPEYVQLDMAPYGGLFFHRSMIDRFGLPLESFALYVDDYEFTWRVRRQGGIIALIPAARIDEPYDTWSTSHANTFHAQLFGPDFRVYYTARNMTYFEANNRIKSRFLYRINKVVYLSILYVMAWRFRKLGRYRLLMQAIHHGMDGQLGVSKEYPLP